MVTLRPLMSSLAAPGGSATQARRRRFNARDARVDRLLRIVLTLAGVLVFLTLIAIVYQVITGAQLAFSRYGVRFIGRSGWIPNIFKFGALPYIYGTLVTGVCSLILSTVLGVSIGLFLAFQASRRVAAVIGPLVEMLAAIPSVVLGLIGVVLICPFLKTTVEPPLHSVLGFLPFFGSPEPVGNSLFAAILVLTIMVVPIIAALSRDVFRSVPIELRDGAEALGATRWEMIRGVVLPTTVSGVTAACVLGFGRAIGEAIAVAQVVGGLAQRPADIFKAGDTMGAAIATQFNSPANLLHTSSLYYLAAILLVFGLATNFVARMITVRAQRRG